MAVTPRQRRNPSFGSPFLLTAAAGLLAATRAGATTVVYDDADTDVINFSNGNWGAEVVEDDGEVFHATLSSSDVSGAQLQFTFKGEQIVLVGTSTGTSTVSIDGSIYTLDASSPNGELFRQRGLSNTESHTLILTVGSGASFTLDQVKVIYATSNGLTPSLVSSDYTFTTSAASSSTTAVSSISTASIPSSALLLPSASTTATPTPSAFSTVVRPSSSIPTSSAASTSSQSDSSPSTSTSSSARSGAIAGGVIGGLIFLVALFYLIRLCVKRRKGARESGYWDSDTGRPRSQGEFIAGGVPVDGTPRMRQYGGVDGDGHEVYSVSQDPFGAGRAHASSQGAGQQQQGWYGRLKTTQSFYGVRPSPPLPPKDQTPYSSSMRETGSRASILYPSPTPMSRAHLSHSTIAAGRFFPAPHDSPSFAQNAPTPFSSPASATPNRHLRRRSGSSSFSALQIVKPTAGPGPASPRSPRATVSSQLAMAAGQQQEEEERHKSKKDRTSYLPQDEYYARASAVRVGLGLSELTEESRYDDPYSSDSSDADAYERTAIERDAEERKFWQARQEEDLSRYAGKDRDPRAQLAGSVKGSPSSGHSELMSRTWSGSTESGREGSAASTAATSVDEQGYGKAPVALRSPPRREHYTIREEDQLEHLHGQAC